MREDPLADEKARLVHAPRHLGERAALLLPEPLIRPGLIAIETALGLLRLPPYWSAQGAWFFGRRHRFDDAATRSELGLKPIALDQTVEDAIRWMARTGHISQRLAGKLAA